MKQRADAFTADFFEVPEAPAPIGGSLDYDRELRHTLTQGITRTGRSRYDVAARMSELVGAEITKAQLDSWTAESKSEWRFPFEYAAAFEAACESTCLQELLGRKRGSRILVGKETLLAELGRIKTAQHELTERERLINARIRGKR